MAIARDGDEFFAVQDVCSHAAVALTEGEVDDCTVECWLHGSRFDLRTGKPTGLPATEPVATFPVESDGDDVYVDTTTTLNGVTPLMSTLEIKDLHVSVDTEDGPKEILKGVTLTIKDGETHAIMGPNGSGKSTLAYSIAGHPKYNITGGTVTLDGDDVLAMTVDERARAGLFLAMQYPVEVPGVSVSNFLRTAKTAIDGEAPKLRTWVKDVNAAMEQLNLDPPFVAALVNEGFSGGEKKRHEIAQLELLEPQGRDPRRDRLRPRHRRAQDRRRGRQPVPRAGGQGRPADHALHADPALHPARLRARLRRRPDRRGGRPGAGRPARGRGLRQVPQERRSDHDLLPGLLPELEVIRKDFPILERTLAGGQPLVYLDSANTSQKPQVVIDTMVDHLERHNANIARAMHQLGAESTEAFEARARQGGGVHRRARRATR